MVEWRDGYVVDLTYATQAYPELAPATIAAMAAMNGVATPDLTAPAYLELGFGQGLSLAIAAAGHPGVYRGVDFIADHVANARALGEAAGANLAVSSDSLIDYAAQEDGAEFDLITLHGVWSWVDDASRAAIRQILARRLRPGGIALISYNTPAGWAPLDPLREMFIRHAAASGLPPAEAMKGAIDYGRELAALGGKYFQDTPAAGAELERIASQDPQYLVHEFLNSGHRTLSFADTQEALAGTGLTYIGPARFAEYLDRRRLKAEAMAVVERYPDPKLQEMARDLMQAQRFRSDLYFKGDKRPMEEAERRALRFTLTQDGEAPPVVEGGGQPGFQTLCDRVFAALAAEGARPKTLGDLIAACPDHRPERVDWAVMALAAHEACAPLSPGAAKGAEARALNRALAANALKGPAPAVFASPVTGAGITLRPIVQMLLAAREMEGDPAPRVLAALKARGEALLKGGAPVTEEAESLSILRDMAADEVAMGLPRLRRLGAV